MAKTKEDKIVLKIQSDNTKKEKTTIEKIADIIAREAQTPTKLRVTGQWILVEEVVVKPIEITKAGIILPNGTDTSKEKEMTYDESPLQGVIIKVGPLEAEKGEFKPLDYVYLAKTPRNAIMHNGKWFALVINLDIAAVVE